jgi:HlyD family secretion protein
MNEARLQVIQLKQKFQEEVSAQLLETRQKIEAATEKLVVARDMITRLDIKSPRSGTVQGLKVFTVGQVVRAGESLMEIVPSGELLVVHAQLPVNSIEHLSIGQTAEIRFPGLHSRQLQMMSGKLASISHDRRDRHRRAHGAGIHGFATGGRPASFVQGLTHRRLYVSQFIALKR